MDSLYCRRKRRSTGIGVALEVQRRENRSGSHIQLTRGREQRRSSLHTLGVVSWREFSVLISNYSSACQVTQLGMQNLRPRFGICPSSILYLNVLNSDSNPLLPQCFKSFHFSFADPVSPPPHHAVMPRQ